MSNEQFIKGLEQFIADFKPFCGNKEDWKRVYAALDTLKESEPIVRCKECKHLFGGEHTKNCCDVLMEKAGWLKEISISPDWFCADGERR